MAVPTCPILVMKSLENLWILPHANISHGSLSSAPVSLPMSFACFWRGPFIFSAHPDSFFIPFLVLILRPSTLNLQSTPSLVLTLSPSNPLIYLYFMHCRVCKCSVHITKPHSYKELSCNCPQCLL